jgi:hypothetical protein
LARRYAPIHGRASRTISRDCAALGVKQAAQPIDAEAA